MSRLHSSVHRHVERKQAEQVQVQLLSPLSSIFVFHPVVWSKFDWLITFNNELHHNPLLLRLTSLLCTIPRMLFSSHSARGSHLLRRPSSHRKCLSYRVRIPHTYFLHFNFYRLLILVQICLCKFIVGLITIYEACGMYVFINWCSSVTCVMNFSRFV